MPKITIIVPIFNTAKYLGRCLESILGQTYQNLEIICINDGSTDDSQEILDSFAKKDSRIKVITQKNQGLSRTRNTGIKKATGDFITFVDSDDEIDKKMVGDLLRIAQSTNSEIAICSFKETFKNGKTKLFPHDDKKTIYSPESAIKAMLKEQNFNLVATMKLFSKDTIKNIQFPIDKVHEDVGFTYKAILQAKRLVFIPKNYYIYHHHDNSIIAKFNDKKFDLINLTDGMCDDIDKEFPNLKNVTNERRMRARFSILRQIPLNHPKAKSIQKYLKENKFFITKNPESTFADKIALKFATTNIRLFQFAYKLFK